MAIWNAENKNSITASYLEEVFGEKKRLEKDVDFDVFVKACRKRISLL